MEKQVQEMFDRGLQVLQKVAGEAAANAVKYSDAYNEHLKQKEFDNAFNIEKEICNSSNYIVLADWIPRNQEVADRWMETAQALLEHRTIKPLINDIEMDPHLQYDLSTLRKNIAEIGFDPSIDLTTTVFKADSVVLLGTGSGQGAANLLKRLNPSILTVIVSSWVEFASSFFLIDWVDLWNEYCLDNNKNIHIIMATEKEGVSSYLQTQVLPIIDHTFVCSLSQANDQLNEYRKHLFDPKSSRAIFYSGFIMDEYNMIFNSWKSLKKQPKIFRPSPVKDPSGCAIVCGSGTSLDKSIEKIRELKGKGAFIIACASNYGPLRAANIDVDLLCLLERGEFMVKQYQEIIDKYGAGSTKLLASVTCPSELHDMFDSTMIYFRPALTPLAIFAESPSQVLIREGPQTINTGVALAYFFGFKDICLAGVDLGTTDLENVRCSHAIGEQDRIFDVEVEGNFELKAYTNHLLIDGATVLELIAAGNRESKLKLTNASDGIKIKGWPKCSLQELLDSINVKNNLAIQEVFHHWWNTSKIYSKDRFMSKWIASNPRVQIYNKAEELNQIITSNLSFKMMALYADKCVRISGGTPAEQFFPRVIRGHIIKLLAAIYRQVIIMSEVPELQEEFLEKAKTVLSKRVLSVRSDLLELCDILEAL